MNRIEVFDMDGTLLDSQRATITAYQQAANELDIPLPENFWGKAASQWQCPAQLHHRKVEIYTSMLATIRPAWAWGRLCNAVRDKTMHRIWTGASFATVTTLCLNTEFAKHLWRATAGMTTEDKRTAMRRLRYAYPQHTIYYYDDNMVEAVKICVEIPNITIITEPKGEPLPCEL